MMQLKSVKAKIWAIATVMCILLFTQQANATSLLTATREVCNKAKNVANLYLQIRKCTEGDNLDVSQKKPPQANYQDPNDGSIEGTPISYASVFSSTIGYDESDGSGRAEVSVTGSFDGVDEEGYVLELSTKYSFEFESFEPQAYIFEPLYSVPSVIATVTLTDSNQVLISEFLLEHLVGTSSQLDIPAAGIYTLDIALGIQETNEAPLGNSIFSTQSIGVQWAPIPEPSTLLLASLAGVLLGFRRRRV